MEITLSGSGSFRAWLQEGTLELKLRISGITIRCLENGKWELVNVRTIGGLSRSITNNIEINTPTATNETGGDDKA